MTSNGTTRLLSGLTFLSLCISVFSAPEIRFFFGKVLGIDKLAEGSQRVYSAYYGIPFAQPPVGELRFQAPQRVIPAGPNTVVTTDAIRTACFQPTYGPSNGFQVSEDCLYLNVYVPVGASQSNVKKVMVYIHGGGFLAGDTYKYVPSRLVTEHDVIVVTTNYRLGVFGFLSSGEGDGNYGLLDQVAALQWVRENIGSFGGDPNDVTVFANSAGALSTSLLSISPKAKGLFTKVILQSSTALNARSVKEDPAAQFDKLARAAGCTPWFYTRWLRSMFMNRIKSCLRRMPTQELYGLAASLRPYNRQTAQRFGQGFGTDNDNMYNPVVDGNVIARHPARLMSDRRYLQEVGALDRSYIVGVNNNEALLMAEIFMQTGGDVTSINQVETAEALLTNVLKDKFTLGVPREVEAVTNYEYLWPRTGGRPPLQGVLNLYGDYQFVIPSVMFARALVAAHNQTKVFMYLFDHFPRVTNPSLGINGSSHAMELAYLFDTNAWTRQYDYYTTVPDPSRGDQALYDVFQGAWSQFAKTGSPSGYLSGRASPWPAFDAEYEDYLAISTGPEVRSHLYAKRVALWTEFFRRPMGRVTRRRYY